MSEELLKRLNAKQRPASDPIYTSPLIIREIKVPNFDAVMELLGRSEDLIQAWDSYVPPSNSRLLEFIIQFEG